MHQFPNSFTGPFKIRPGNKRKDQITLNDPYLIPPGSVTAFRANPDAEASGNSPASTISQRMCPTSICAFWMRGVRRDGMQIE